MIRRGKMMVWKIGTLILLGFLATVAAAQNETLIPSGSKVFIAPMGGYENFLRTAIEKKKVTLKIVSDKNSADFEITGTSESQKAGVAKILITGSWHSNEESSITVTNLKTGIAAFGYTANKQNSVHGKRSSAEAIAKHLKEKIESKR
jgi:hypothetical protein